MEENKELITRVAVCVVAALIVYYGVDKLGDSLHMELLDKYRPWLTENKVQAVAAIAAVFFGISTAAFPLPLKQEEIPVEPNY